MQREKRKRSQKRRNRLRSKVTVTAMKVPLRLFPIQPLVDFLEQQVQSQRKFLLHRISTFPSVVVITRLDLQIRLLLKVSIFQKESALAVNEPISIIIFCPHFLCLPQF